MGHENGTFIEGTTEAHIQDLVDAYDPSQTAVILDRTMRIPSSSSKCSFKQTKRNVYVSTTIRQPFQDIKTVCEWMRARSTRSLPLDMFPQTQHVECVTDIRLKQS